VVEQIIIQYTLAHIPTKWNCASEHKMPSLCSKVLNIYFPYW